jgi:hypothetical protein
MLFQLVRLEVSEEGAVLSRRETQPLFELREDAMAMAELEASRAYDECKFDADHSCWIVRDSRDRSFRLVVEPIAHEKAA